MTCVENGKDIFHRTSLGILGQVGYNTNAVQMF